MTTTTPDRTVRVIGVARPGRHLLVKVTEPNRRKDPVVCYWIERVATDFGHAWSWQALGKSEQKPYMADLSAMKCDCPHGKRWRRGDRVCRHLSAVAVLLAAGKLEA